MTAFNYYRRIKDKICLVYEGHAPEYLIQLRMLRRSFESKFPEIHLTYACRNQYKHYLTRDASSISLDQYNKDDYGYSIPVVYNARIANHPILSFVKESNVSIQSYKVNGSVSYSGIICPEGNFPNVSLTDKQINHLKNWLVSKKMKPVVIGTSFNETKLVEQRPSPEERRELARKAGFVIGIECDMLYEAIEVGIPTALASIGPEKELYELICGKPIILNV